jgi:hypothetical protein
MSVYLGMLSLENFYVFLCQSITLFSLYLSEKFIFQQTSRLTQDAYTVLCIFGEYKSKGKFVLVLN